MASQVQKWNEERRDAEIMKLAAMGIHTYDIIDKLKEDCGIEVSYSTVNNVLKEGIALAKEQFVTDASSLLVKSYMRLEMLIEQLMPGAMKLEMNHIDRVQKLIKTQIELITRTQPQKIEVSGDPNNPILHHHVFTTDDPEYQRALGLALNDPNFEIIDGELKFLAAASQVNPDEEINLDYLEIIHDEPIEAGES